MRNPFRSNHTITGVLDAGGENVRSERDEQGCGGGLVSVGVFVAVETCWRCRQPTGVIVGVDVPGVGPVPIDDVLTEAFGSPALDQWRASRGIGAVRRRASKTAQRVYMSQGCRNCDVLLGTFFLQETFIGLEADGVLDEHRVDDVTIDAAIVARWLDE